MFLLDWWTSAIMGDLALADQCRSLLTVVEKKKLWGGMFPALNLFGVSSFTYGTFKPLLLSCNVELRRGAECLVKFAESMLVWDRWATVSHWRTHALALPLCLCCKCSCDMWQHEWQQSKDEMVLHAPKMHNHTNTPCQGEIILADQWPFRNISQLHFSVFQQDALAGFGYVDYICGYPTFDFTFKCLC